LVFILSKESCLSTISYAYGSIFKPQKKTTVTVKIFDALGEELLE
jgi:hypothetical protein